MAVAASGAPRLLIVRRDNIGDLACTTPLIEALRARLPRARIEALVNTYNAEVLARNPALDRVWAYEKLKHRTSALPKHLFQRVLLGARLRRERFDYVLVPAPTPQALRIAAALRPAKLIAAGAGEGEARHEVERTFDLGRALGLDGAPGPMRVYPDADRIAALRARVPAPPLVAVHISARRAAQRWPRERYAELIVSLVSRSSVVLLWSPGPASDPRHPGDDEAAAAIARRVDRPELVPVATPDLATLIAALSLADRVVCPDGGAMHLAAALGKPVVALFGDSPVERWRPWGVPHRVVRPQSRNLADLEVAPVLQALRELG